MTNERWHVKSANDMMVQECATSKGEECAHPQGFPLVCSGSEMIRACPLCEMKSPDPIKTHTIGAIAQYVYLKGKGFMPLDEALDEILDVLWRNHLHIKLES